MAGKTLRELALLITGNAASFNKTSQEVANKTAAMKKSANAASDGFKGLGSTLTQSIAPGLSSITNMAQSFGSNLSKLMSGIIGTSKATTVLNGVWKVTKITLASLGIPAIVMAIASLVSWFKNTKAGADVFNKAIGGIKAVIQGVLHTVNSLGEAFHLLLKGKFKEAADKAKEAFTGLGERIKTNYQEGRSIAEQENALKKKQIDFTRQQADLEAQISDLRLTASDKSKDTATREQAIAKALELQKQLSTDKYEIAKAEYNLLTAKNALGDNTYEDDQAEADLYAAMVAAEKERTDKMREMVAMQNEIKNSVKQEKVEREKAAAAAKKLINYQKEVEFYTGQIAILEKDIADNRELMNDTEQSYVVRIKAANDALDETNKLYKSKIAYQEAVVRAAEDAYNQDQDNYDLYKDMVDKQKELKQLREDQIDQTKELQDTIALNTYEYEKQTQEKKDQVAITRELSAAEKAMVQDIEEQRAALTEAQRKFEELYGVTEKFNSDQFWNRFTDKVQVSADGITVAKGKVEEFFKAFPELTKFEDFFITLADGSKQLNTELSKKFLAGQIEELLAFGETGYQATQKVKTGIEELGKFKNETTFKDLFPPLETISGYLQYFKAEWNDAWKEMGNEAVNVSSILQNYMAGAIDTITTSFTQLFQGQKQGWASIVTAALQAAQQIVNALLAEAIAAMIAKESHKGIIGLALAAVGVAGLTALWNTLVPKMAEGAYVSKPTYAMIGERGPEWVLNKGQMASLLSARSGPVEVQGLVRVSGQDLLIAIQNAENFKRSY